MSLKPFIFSFLLLSLCSCGKDAPAEEKAPPSAVVTAFLVKAQDTPISYEFVAQTQSSHLVNIQARVNGFLDEQVYKEGDIVKKDQVLFVMDKKPFEVQVQAAQAAEARQLAALETARLNLNRVEPLAKLNALSQKDLDDARGQFETNAATLEHTKAELESAMLNLSYCTIISPIEGITSAALIQEGTYISAASNQLTTVSALSPIWVNFSLSEKQVQTFQDQVKSGEIIAPEDDKFTVKIIQINGQIFPHTGKITFTEPYFNPQTGTFLIRASVDNPNGYLRPNQYVRAKIEGVVRPNAILVPQRAVQQSTKGQFVWVINSGKKAEFRPVTVGDWQGDNWFIIEGLKSGEKVAVDGVVGLHPGGSVEIKQILNETVSDENIPETNS